MLVLSSPAIGALREMLGGNQQLELWIPPVEELKEVPLDPPDGGEGSLLGRSTLSAERDVSPGSPHWEGLGRALGIPLIGGLRQGSLIPSKERGRACIPLIPQKRES